MRIEKELKGLAKSFTFAIRGVKKSIISERNMRIHLVVGIYLLTFSLFYNFKRAEYILLILSISMVISCELMNTAVEAVVDLVSPTYNKIAQVAKDISAGAVFVSAIFAMISGFLLFFDTNVFMQIIRFFSANWLLLVALVVSSVLSLVFIFDKNMFNSKKIKNRVEKPPRVG